MKTLTVKTREEWRRWLARNHATQTEVWLVFHKRRTDVADIPYAETVEEALCFGWVDSIIKRLDDGRYVRKYTPRRPGSAWSVLNKARVGKMIRQGRMTDAGLARVAQAKESGDWQRKAVAPATARRRDSKGAF